MTAARRQRFKIARWLFVETDPHDGGTDVTFVARRGAVEGVLGRWLGLVAKRVGFELYAVPDRIGVALHLFSLALELNIDIQTGINTHVGAALDWGMAPAIRLTVNLGEPREQDRIDVDLRDVAFGPPKDEITILAACNVPVELPEGPRRVRLSWERVRHVRPRQPAALEPDFVHLVIRPVATWWPSRTDEVDEIAIPWEGDPNRTLPDMAKALEMYRSRLLVDRLRYGGQITPPDGWVAPPDAALANDLEDAQILDDVGAN